MKYKPEQEMELLERILSFAYDPEAFVMYVYPWGEKGTPLEHVKGPRKWQLRVLRSIKKHVTEQQFALDNELLMKVFKECDASGRGIGKSALFGWLSHWQVSCHLGSSVVVTANTEGQLRSKSFPEFGRWIGMSLNSHWFHIDSMKIYPQDWLAQMVQEQLKINPMYWNISGVNWSEENPDAFAGTHNAYGLMVLYDEASGIPKPIWNVTEGFFTELNPFRFWLAFSNPRRNSGPFFERFHNEIYRGEWGAYQIDAREVEGSDQSVYEAIIREHGPDSDTARIEVYGQFPEAGENQFISNTAVRGAQDREIEVFDDGEPLIMGVDPAPRGRTVIRFRQGRDARSIKPVVLNGSDNVQIVNTIVNLVNKYNPDAIAIDGGNGTGVIDLLKKKKIRVHEVWFGARAEGKPPSQENSPGEKFANIGTELWAEIRDWLPGGCIDREDPTLPDDPARRLFNDLTKRTWKWHGREEGAKILTAKKDMAADGIPSPDDADALALTFYPKVPRRNRTLANRYGPTPQPIAIGVGECNI